MGYTREDMEELDKIMRLSSDEVNQILNTHFTDPIVMRPKYLGFKKERKCNNAQRPKPRKKKRK